MASEIFANRAELRRRLLARMGATTDTTVYSQSTEQINEFLRAAAQTVRDRCEWKRNLSEFYFSTGVDQRFYNYPTNVGPGDIVRIARWDDDSEEYVTLQRRLILPILDNDPTFSGTDEIATRNKPILWEDSSQLVNDHPIGAIELNPLPDAIYKMKIEAYAASQLTDDTTPSDVDADCIVLFALADILESDGEIVRADRQRAQGESRIRTLAGAQRTGGKILRGRADKVELKYGRGRWRDPPNFDTSLSRMPGP